MTNHTENGMNLITNLPATLLLALFFILSIPSPLLSQPMPPRGGLDQMMSQEEFDAARADAKTTVTNEYNFGKRINFAREWMFRLLRRHQRALESVAPIGTLQRLRSDERTEPSKTYAELDRILAEFERLDSSPGADDEPYRQGRGQRKPGMEGRHGMGREPTMRPPMMAKRGDTGASSYEMSLVNPASGVNLWGKVFHPRDVSKKYPAIAYIPGALGYGSQYGNEQAASTIASSGFVVAIFDPDGRGKSGGKEDYNGKVHQDGLNALLKQLAAHPLVDPGDIGVVTVSYGVAMGAGAIARHPDDPPVKYLIDVEGPSDRRRITFNDAPETVKLFGGHLSSEKEFWDEREPLLWIKKIKASYLRIQSERDHVQPDNGHAVDLVNAATGEKHGGGGLSPWTRINGPENSPNTVYSMDKPPRYFPGTGVIRTEELVGYAREMATQTASSSAPPSGVDQKAGAAYAASAASSASGKAILNVFYLIHVHSASGYTPEFVAVPDESYEATAKALMEIAGALEKRGAKGTFHFMQGFADTAARRNGPSGNVITTLEARGHEIGAHVHTDANGQWRKTIEAVRRAGAKKVKSFSGSKTATGDIKLLLEEAVTLGIQVINGNNTPIDPRPLRGMENAQEWGTGGNAQVYRQTGSFIFPWRPSVASGRLHENDSAGKLVYIDNVSMLSWTDNGVMDSGAFNRLAGYFNAAIRNVRTDKVNAWGFVTHEIELQEGMGPNKAKGRINEAALRAFDGFLAEVEGKGSAVRWATVSEIAEKVE